MVGAHTTPHTRLTSQDGEEASGRTGRPHQQDVAAHGQRQDDAAHAADAMGDPADPERGADAHELAAHEERADLGVADCRDRAATPASSS